MKMSQYFIPTLKEIPSDAEVISHQLMLRAGMIRKLTSGIYTYLPLGLRCIKKVENIIREEMNRAGAIELLMPAVQPAELWQESGRWDYYGKELLRFKDRNNRDCCIGPTHEEIITDLVRKEIHSYRQMPVNFYQIQTKFRDEIRPRFGIMRCREFIMKDAYSFDVDEESAQKSYQIMYDTYCRIFKRCGLEFKAVEADTGAIGGSFSHEFMVLANTGEDQIVDCQSCDYAANLEKAEIKAPDGTPAFDSDDLLPMEEVETPNIKTVEEVTSFLNIGPESLIKTLIFNTDGKLIAGLVRGDHEINEAKLRSLLKVDRIELASEEMVEEVTGAPMGFAGPVGLKIDVIADHSIRDLRNAVTGANKKDMHLKNVNLERDFTVHQFADIRMIRPDDPCPRCGGSIEFKRGIEVGHIFKLGIKYSQAMNAVYLDRDGKEKPIVMGCYGIGVGRTVAAAIEQNHDRDGIIFPIPIAPFEVIVLPLQIHNKRVLEISEDIYRALRDKGVDVLMDDRDLRPGVKFKDAELIGIPIRVTIGEKGIEKGEVEIKLRGKSEKKKVSVSRAISSIMGEIKGLYDKIQ